VTGREYVIFATKMALCAMFASPRLSWWDIVFTACSLLFWSNFLASPSHVKIGFEKIPRDFKLSHAGLCVILVGIV